jgi:hypothetical protein
MQDAEIPQYSAPEVEVSTVAGDLTALVHMATAGLLGAGVVVMYFSMAFWVSGWRTHPKYADMEWQGWMLLSVFGIGLILIVAGIALSVYWLARAQRAKEALFWGISSLVVLALTFAATVATVIDATSYGD